MKIVCEACSAKYSIADEKVRGKVFKIRCKKCSHIIVVRGEGASAPPTTDTAPAGAAGGAQPGAEPVGQPNAQVWYTVVDGEQVGPLSDAEMEGRIARRELSTESYGWREGMADWLPLASIAHFAEPLRLAAAAAPAADPESPFAPQPTAVMPPGAAEEMLRQAEAEGAAPDSPSGQRYPSVSNDPFAALAGGSAGGAAGDLFAPSAAAPAADPFAASAPPMAADPLGTTSPDAPAPAASAMTGQRSENSVLFSLSNLESLAAPAATSTSTAPGMASATSSPGAPRTSEGSGLIDIRQMAQVTLAPGAAAGSNPASGEQFPSFGAAPMSPVAAPMLPNNSGRKSSSWLIPVLVLMGVLVAGTVVLAAVVLKGGGLSVFTQGDDSSDTPGNQAAPEPVEPKTEETQPVSTSTPTAEAPASAKSAEGSSGELPKAAAEAKTSENPGDSAKSEKQKALSANASGDSVARKSSSKPQAKRKTERRPPSAPQRPRNAVAAPAPRNVSRPESRPAPKAPPAPPPPSRSARSGKKSDSLDDLLAGALSGGSTRSQPSRKAPAPEASTPKPAATGSLSKQDIVRGMSKVLPSAQACYKRYKVPGRANFNVKVAPSGNVSSAAVGGMFKGTPTGKCVESAVRGAKFPPSRNGLTFPYSVTLK